jgi:hypothetical protein
MHHSHQNTELQDPRSYTRRYLGCPHQIAAADRKLRAALLAEFNDTAIADRVMRVIKEQRA